MAINKQLSRKQLNLDISPELYDLLQKLAKITSTDIAGVLRTGVALYGIAEDARQEGNKLGIINGENVIKEIVIDVDYSGGQKSDKINKI